MKTRGWFVVVFSIVFFVSAGLYLDLQTTQIEKQNTKMAGILDEAERDMGIYDSAASRKKGIYPRMMELSRAAQAQADAKRAQYDSLTSVLREYESEEYWNSEDTASATGRMSSAGYEDYMSRR